jgi:hypothetical protein
MKLAAKILCRTLGTAGMGVALYDASQVCGQYARNGAEHESSKYLENAYFNSRTVDEVSFSDNSLRQKTFDLRTKNPLPALWGKAKYGSYGVLYSLGSNLPLVASSACALVSKGTLAKIGALGTVLITAYKVLRNGYSMGRQNPME